MLLIDLVYFQAILGDETASERMAIFKSEPKENLMTVRRLNRISGTEVKKEERKIITVDSSSDLRKRMFTIYKALTYQLSKMIKKILIGYVAIVSGLFVCKMLRLF